ELFVFYKSRLMGMNALLEPLPVQYKDYSAWHNEMILNGKLKDAGVYWHTKLSGEIPVLSLPTDLVRPLVQSFQGDRINFIISKENTDSLRELCKANGVSLFMFFVALVKVLLYRYSSQEDIIVGSPVAGRQHKDLEGQIGYYVNTLALRDKVMGKDSFRSLLKQVKKTVTN
ncbi:MAG: non-ribosomal peptide synthetase, partial [Victivallales bacterium]|nr:non-ribosomal peptide synthetase [Victivallales bacterium]